MNYTDLYRWSIQDPEGFWDAQAQAIHWHRKPLKSLERLEDGSSRWFPDGQLNTSWLAIDHHIAQGRGDETALVYDSPVTQTVEWFTYNDMHREVSRLAGGLRKLGVAKGDTVIIYMPMIPQAVFSMLACARLGAIHSVVFGGFAAHELAIRIDDCHPKVLITASSGIEVNKIIPYKPIVDEAINLAQHKPEHVVVFNRRLGANRPDKSYDVDYSTLVKVAEPVDAVPVEAHHPLYILYTSGTTGKPKGIVRDHGGHAVALHFSMKHVYGMQPGETFWAASDVGWVVGHSYIVYAPLLYGCRTVLYEGKPVRTPDAGSFWRVIEEHQVKVLFTAPTAIRAIRQEDSEGHLAQAYDLSGLRHLFLAGERCDTSTLEWAKALLQRPVIDHWWQTESGWPMLANLAGVELLEVPAGSAGMPVPGYNIQVINADGTKAQAGTEGIVVVKQPLPPGTLQTIWGNAARFHNGYLQAYPGYYLSGDGGFTDENGFVFITGRIDDIINVAGHRLSTAEMEEVVATLPEVAECCVVGAADELKGQIPIALYTTKAGIGKADHEIEAAIVQAVRKEIGAVASLKQAVHVQRLPKTRSGKILRRLVRAILDGESYTLPSTLDDLNIPQEIEETLKSGGWTAAKTTTTV